MFPFLLPRLLTRDAAVTRGARAGFERAYRRAWDIRRFTASADVRPLVAALAQEGLVEGDGRDGRLVRGALRAWRLGVVSERAAWRLARAGSRGRGRDDARP